MASGDVVFEMTNCPVQSIDFHRVSGSTNGATVFDVVLDDGDHVAPADTTTDNYDSGSLSFSISSVTKTNNTANNPPNVLDPSKRYRVQITEV